MIVSSWRMSDERIDSRDKTSDVFFVARGRGEEDEVACIDEEEDELGNRMLREEMRDAGGVARRGTKMKGATEKGCTSEVSVRASIRVSTVRSREIMA